MNKKLFYPFICFLVLLGLHSQTMAGEILDKIKARGHLVCGVSDGLAGFSKKNAAGKWQGLDVDYCRALSAAIFDDSEKVEYIVTNVGNRFPDLNAGKVDVLVRNTTWTLGRETEHNINFVGVNFYDGQGFMVKKDLGIYSVNHLNGASFCVEDNTTTKQNLIEYYKTNNMKIEVKAFPQIEPLIEAFFSGQCDVYTSDMSTLASVRASDAPNAYEYMILPEAISKEPLGPSIKSGDTDLFNIARWTLYALLSAEELGITKKNIDTFMRSTNNPEAKRLLGVTPGMGAKLGLSERWAYNIIKQVGNYGEIFAANVGVDSELKLPRGRNELWNKGGLMYSPPVR